MLWLELAGGNSDLWAHIFNHNEEEERANLEGSKVFQTSKPNFRDILNSTKDTLPKPTQIAHQLETKYLNA